MQESSSDINQDEARKKLVKNDETITKKTQKKPSCNTIHVSFVNESVISLIDDYLKSVLRSCQMARMELSAKTINSFMTEVPIL